MTPRAKAKVRPQAAPTSSFGRTPTSRATSTAPRVSPPNTSVTATLRHSASVAPPRKKRAAGRSAREKLSLVAQVKALRKDPEQALRLATVKDPALSRYVDALNKFYNWCSQRGAHRANPGADGD